MGGIRSATRRARRTIRSGSCSGGADGGGAGVNDPDNRCATVESLRLICSVLECSWCYFSAPMSSSVELMTNPWLCYAVTNSF